MAEMPQRTAAALAARLNPKGVRAPMPMMTGAALVIAAKPPSPAPNPACPSAAAA